MLNPDFVIKPVDGFGNHEIIRNILINERPDAVLLFTDPRQFFWLWDIEDEIHQICPITYWHVWDNDPYPDQGWFSLNRGTWKAARGQKTQVRPFET